MCVKKLMINKYIKKDNKIIKVSIYSLSIYFGYFSPGIRLPAIFDYKMTRKLAHQLLYTSIVLAYFTNFYKLIYKVESIEENAEVVIKGRGREKNLVKLIKTNNKLKVIKVSTNAKTYTKEKSYFDKYNLKSNNILFPNYRFVGDKTIEMDFIKKKTFQRLIMEGNLSLNESLIHFINIKNNLKLLYGPELTLIHGDLCPVNIFIDNKKYFFIDFSNSHESTYKFDLYVLLYSIFLSFNLITNDQDSIENSKISNKRILSLLDLDKDELNDIEVKYKFLRNQYALNSN